MTSQQFFAGLLLSVTAGACSDSKVARISIPQKVLRIYTKTPTVINAQPVNAQGMVVQAGALSYSATPVSVLTTSGNGMVSCVGSGDGSIIISGGGQSAVATVSCRLVHDIVGLDTATLVIGRVAEAPKIEPVGENGLPMTGVSMMLSSADPGTVRIDGGRMVPVGVGRTVVHASAGDAAKDIKVSVVELLRSEALALRDGAAVTIALQQGSYELDIAAKPATGGGNDGVVVSWVGADCPKSAESQEMHVHCVVPATASLTVVNPSTLGLGAAVTGFISLYRTAQ